MLFPFKSKMGYKFLMVFVVLIAFTATTSATTIHVNATGWWIDYFNQSSTPIQSAINNARAGDVVIIDAGTYDESVIVNKSITVRSSENSPAHTKITSNSRFTVEITADNVTIANLSVENTGVGSSSNYYSAIHSNARFTSVIDCNITTYNDNVLGVWIAGGNGLVDNNTIRTSGRYGYGIDIHSNYNNASNNTITTSGYRGYGILVSGSGNNVTGNTITTSGEYGWGIMMIYTSSNHNNIKNNRITTTGIYAYGIVPSDQNSIDSNTISTSGDNSYGIYIYNCVDSNTVTNNTITTSGSYGTGIHIDYYSTSNTIRNNTVNVSGYLASGILVQYYSDSNNIISNTIHVTGSPGWGIEIDYFSDSNVTDNSITVSGDGGRGILVWASVNNISNNVIVASGNNSCGIYLDASSNTITNDTITAYYGIHLQGTNNVLTNVTFNSTYPTKVSITSYYGIFNLSAVNNLPPTPNGWFGVGRYINITGSGSGWIFVNFTYNDREVTNESALKVLKYNGSWYEDGWNGTRVLDTNNNVVGVNITEANGIFAPMEKDTIPPSITFSYPSQVYRNTSRNFTITINDTYPSMYRIYLNGTIIQQGGYQNNTPINVSINTTTLGNKTYTIWANDTVNNTNSTTIHVNVVNNPPVASFTASKTSVYARETIIFNASRSYDPDGSIVSYSWDFGDGSSGSGVTISHAYSSSGTYTVTLTVRDNNGATNQISKQIVVTTPQTVGGKTGGRAGTPFVPPPLEAPSESEYLEVNTFPANERIILELPPRVSESTGLVKILAKVSDKMTLSIAVSKARGLPENVPSPPHKVYMMFEVVFAKYGTKVRVEPSGEIYFKVAKDWIAREKVSEISLMKYNPAKMRWVKPPTIRVGEDGKYVYFRSNLKSFGFFVITGKTKTVKKSPAVIGTSAKPAAKTVQPSTTMSKKRTQTTIGRKSIPGFKLTVSVAAILLALLFRKLK